MAWRGSIIFAAVFSAAALPALADECHPQTLIASVDMGIDTYGHMTVPMTIAGHQVSMMIDTGGAFSSLFDDEVTALKLSKTVADHDVAVGFGGVLFREFVYADNVELGGLKSQHMRFIVFPQSSAGIGFGGTLDPDVLRFFDLDFDFAGAKFNLVSPDHCDGKVVYWTRTTAAQIGFDIDSDYHVKVPVTIDGHQIVMFVDSGASYSALGLETAKKLLGFDGASPALTRVGDDPKSTTYRYPIKSLTFGDGVSGAVTVNNPDIRLISGMYGGGIIGMDILRLLHVYIAYKEKHIYVTPASAH